MSYSGNIPARLDVFNNGPWTDGVEVYDAAGQPVDLTACEARLALMWKERPSPDPTFTASPSEVSCGAGDDKNVANWQIPVERMRTLAPGDYAFEFLVTGDAVGEVRLSGEVRVNRGLNP